MLTEHPDLLTLPDPEAEPFKVTDSMMDQVLKFGDLYMYTALVIFTLSRCKHCISCHVRLWTTHVIFCAVGVDGF